MPRQMMGPSPTKVTLAGLEWDEHYSVYRTIVAGWLVLGFSWVGSDDGYSVIVADAKIKQRGRTPQEAADIAVRAARHLMTKAANALSEAGVGEKESQKEKQS